MQLNNFLVKEIAAVSIDLYEKGYYREAMINSILCLFDMIREESGLQDDGSDLIGRAFSINNPRIILADLQSESGKNIQKGIIQILQGYFQAYRNVASHSLQVNFSEKDALPVLIVISRLYEQISASEKAIFLRYDGLYYNKGELCNNYIRFYSGEVVISVPTIAGHKDIINWFNRENAKDFNNFSIGKYKVNERTIKFFTESSAGKVQYNGIIRPNQLIIKTSNDINGNQPDKDYEFISWNNIKA